MSAIERDYIVAALEAGLDHFDQATENLTQVQLIKRPAEGRWSPLEIIEHMAVVERGVHKGVSFATSQPVSVFGTKEKDALIESYREMPSRIQAPSMVAPSGRFGDDTLRVFRDRRITTINLARALDVDWRAHHATHPLLGPLDIQQWFFFAAQHGERHTDQLERGE